LSPDDFQKKSFAYLKPSLAAASGGVAVERRDAPVLRDLGNGLLVAYLIDEGDRFPMCSMAR